MHPQELFAAVFVTVVFAGVLIVMMGLRQRSQQLEMRHRERMAIIERGMLPTEVERFLPDAASMPPSTPVRRSLTMGIVLMAVGFGLMIFIGVAAGEPSVAVGLGGAVVIVGLAFVAISYVARAGHVPPADPPSSQRPSA